MKPQRIEISSKTIVFTVAFLLSLVLLWNIRDIIILLFISLLFMEVLNPAVNSLDKLKVPRMLSIFIVYFLVIMIFSIALAGIIPALVIETSDLVKTLPATISNLNIFGFTAVDISSQFKILETLPADIAWTIVSFFSNLFTGFLIFVVTFYLLLERKNLDKYSAYTFNNRGQKIISEIFDTIEHRLAGWVNGELILMTVIGLLSYAGYLVIGLNYALPLAIIAAMLEIVPTVGPIVATVVAALIGWTISPLTALLAVIWGIVVQQLENNFIVPKIMSTTVGLHPIITILTITTGAKLGGVGGALLAVPIFIILETIVRVLIAHKK